MCYTLLMERILLALMFAHNIRFLCCLCHYSLHACLPLWLVQWWISSACHLLILPPTSLKEIMLYYPIIGLICNNINKRSSIATINRLYKVCASWREEAQRTILSPIICFALSTTQVITLSHNKSTQTFLPFFNPVLHIFAK